MKTFRIFGESFNYNENGEYKIQRALFEENRAIHGHVFDQGDDRATSGGEKLYFISTDRIDPEKGIGGECHLYKFGRYHF